MTERPYLPSTSSRPERFTGNPLAIFPDGSDIDDATMQRIARELNLSETVFLTRATYRRPICASSRSGREVLFAGHPTVGTAIALVDVRRWLPKDADAFVLRERIGDAPIRIERDGDVTTAWLQTPAITFPPIRSTGRRPQWSIASDGRAARRLPTARAHGGDPVPLRRVRDRASADAVALTKQPACDHGLDAVNGVFVFTPVEGGAYCECSRRCRASPKIPPPGARAGPLEPISPMPACCRSATARDVRQRAGRRDGSALAIQAPPRPRRCARLRRYRRQRRSTREGTMRV